MTSDIISYWLVKIGYYLSKSLTFTGDIFLAQSVWFNDRIFFQSIIGRLCGYHLFTIRWSMIFIYNGDTIDKNDLGYLKYTVCFKKREEQ